MVNAKFTLGIVDPFSTIYDIFILTRNLIVHQCLLIRFIKLTSDGQHSRSYILSYRVRSNATVVSSMISFEVGNGQKACVLVNSPNLFIIGVPRYFTIDFV